jgi:prepilin-type N-terminal cleavage/methylation domain-containing protein
MPRRHGFTLVEMLAVITIMLVLMAATFGMFNLFAERSGPRSVVATLQAALNNAREYATTNGVDTLLEFKNDPAEPEQGTVVTLRYWAVQTSDWQEFPGRQSLVLNKGMYVIQDLPSMTGVTVPSKPTNVRNPSAPDVVAWRDYEQKLLAQVAEHALSGGKISNDTFYVEFAPTGNPRLKSVDAAIATGKLVQNGFTIVQLAGEKVGEFAFYPLNTSTGTRLVFE